LLVVKHSTRRIQYLLIWENLAKLIDKCSRRDRLLWLSHLFRKIPSGRGPGDCGTPRGPRTPSTGFHNPSRRPHLGGTNSKVASMMNLLALLRRCWPSLRRTQAILGLLDGRPRRKFRVRPCLELLEDRLTPSVVIGATKDDSLVTDVDGDGRADPGDTLGYTVVISSTGSTDATGVQFADTVDPNTALVAGSVHASPLAFNDTYFTAGNTKLYVGTTPPAGEPADQLAGTLGLLANDVALTDSTSFTGFTGATSQGGSVTVNNDGTFTYTPKTGFTGADTFT